MKMKSFLTSQSKNITDPYIERMTNPFYGKYRGKISDNTDPVMQGRIRAKVPAILGEQETGWALPSSPYAGAGIGFFFIPPIGANVWIEFEAGNLDYPIWSGCFWDRGGAPTVNAVPQTKMIKTDSATITLNGLPDDGRITIESNSGLKIVMDVSGITLTNCAGLAPIRLDPTNISGAPTSGNHMSYPKPLL